jgi:hypothetical protein
MQEWWVNINKNGGSTCAGIYNTRLKKAREMVADQKLDPDDFRELKAECTTKINELEAKLTGLSQKGNNIDGLLNKAVSNLSALDVLYEEGTITEKRQIIGSIFPEKLTFDGFSYRTARINEAARLIFSLDAGFNEMKNRKNNDNSCLSGLVVPTGLLFYFKPAYYQMVTLSAIRCFLGSPAKIGWWWEFLSDVKVEHF